VADPYTLDSSEIGQFIQELTRRFENDELERVFGPVIKALSFHECLFRPEGLASGDAAWRGVISGLEMLVSNRSVAILMTQMPEFNPSDATAVSIEKTSLLGPLCRLSIFGKDWVSAASAC